MRKVLFCFAVAAVFCSCDSYKHLAYLQDVTPGTAYEMAPHEDTKIHSGDKLRISVYSSQPELAVPFNTYSGISSSVSRSGDTGSSDDAWAYPVDGNGYINFPVIGRQYIQGMSLHQLQDYLRDCIIKTGFIKDPTVRAEFTNFEVSIFGEVEYPGIYNFPDGNVNVLEIIAKARELTDDGMRSKVLVTRLEGSSRTTYSLDLRSGDIFDSPAFYLQQGDMVYIAPEKTKADNRSRNWSQTILAPVSVLTALLSATAFIIALTK